MLQARENVVLAAFTSDNGDATAGVRFYLRSNFLDRVCSTFEIEHTVITYGLVKTRVNARLTRARV